MKAIILLLACVFALNLQAAPDFSPLQREAVRFMIEESGERADSERFVGLLRLSKVLTKKELKRFPEVLVHKNYQYVLIKIEDQVYDLAIVVIDPQGKGVSSLYIDFRNRGKMDW